MAGVRALLRRMGAESALADDLAQDAFLQAFERMGDFRGEGAFAGWVKRIAARRYLKRRRSGLRLESALADDDGLVDARGPAPGDRLDLDAALQGLAESERVCVSLCFGAGLTHAEAADALGAPLGTVKSHIKRGLEKLRRRMGVEPPPSAPTPDAGGAHG